MIPDRAAVAHFEHRKIFHWVQLPVCNVTINDLHLLLSVNMTWSWPVSIASNVGLHISGFHWFES
jgi:hypothetical protein